MYFALPCLKRKQLCNVGRNTVLQDYEPTVTGVWQGEGASPMTNRVIMLLIFLISMALSFLFGYSAHSMGNDEGKIASVSAHSYAVFASDSRDSKADK